MVFAQAFLLARSVLPKHTIRAASSGRQLCADAATAEALAVLGVLPMNGAAPYVAGGRWRTTPNTFAVTDPATDDVLGHVADCGPPETAAAIQDAQHAFEGWARTPARARSDALRAWHDAILAHAEPLAIIATGECGKPLAEARAEVAYAASFIEWFAEEAPRVAGEVKSNIVQDRRLLTVRQPVGVAAAITPWNFPIAMITRKVAPAIAAGCPVVVKPSEFTPLTALALARLADGLLPPGVLNVLPASRKNAQPVGEVLCDSDVVRALSFTGSTAVGKWLYSRCSSTVKKLGLELGGNAPFIVLQGADVDLAVKAAMASKFRYGGQTCVCADRFLVHDSIMDEFVGKLAAEASSLKLGHGLDAGTGVGPLIDEAATFRCQERVSSAVSQGATVVCGGAKQKGPGHFFEPTVLKNVDVTSELWQLETFGPVAGVVPFTDDAEAIKLANDGPAGLAAYVCGELGHAWAVAEKLDFGIVGVNEGAVSHAAMPFGGTKESGLGREGGRHGIDEYLEDKYICLGGLDM